jgi:hypothetical protein
MARLMIVAATLASRSRLSRLEHKPARELEEGGGGVRAVLPRWLRG